MCACSCHGMCWKDCGIGADNRSTSKHKSCLKPLTSMRVGFPPKKAQFRRRHNPNAAQIAFVQHISGKLRVWRIGLTFWSNLCRVCSHIKSYRFPRGQTITARSISWEYFTLSSMSSKDQPIHSIHSTWQVLHSWHDICTELQARITLKEHSGIWSIVMRQSLVHLPQGSPDTDYLTT